MDNILKDLVKKAEVTEILNIAPKSLDNLIDRYDETNQILGGKKIQGVWNYPRETLLAIKDFAGDKKICIDTLREYQASVSSDTAQVTDIAPVISDNVISDNAALPKLEVEIKFYLKQVGRGIIEVGKRLNQAKELVPHGEWQNWLEQNFNLTSRSARRFMAVAERFGKTDIDVRFQSTQLIAMLALPAGDEEKFIAEKAAEGTPVEDMTIKNLRDEIKKYKDDLQAKDSQIKDLSDKQSKLEGLLEDSTKDISKLTLANQTMQSTLKEKDAENKSLTQKLADAESKSTIETVTVKPADYDELKAKAEKLSTVQAKLDSANQTIDEMKNSTEKTRTENNKITKATAILDNLVNVFRYAHSEFHAIYPNFPAELEDNFNSISDNIKAISKFVLKE